MILLLGFVAVVLQIGLSAANANSPMCREGVPVFNCLIDPCMNAECPANEMAECVPNYCGGCGFDFYVAGRIIDCSTKQSSPKKGKKHHHKHDHKHKHGPKHKKGHKHKKPKPKKCPRVYCPTGKYQNCRRIDGCLYCACAPRCPSAVRCPPNCETVKRNGCPVGCQCKPKTSCPPSIRCPPGCRTIKKNGCPVSCYCVPKPVCPPFIPCPPGCRTIKRNDGCPVKCRCRPRTSQPSSCPVMPACANRCQYGYLKNKFGCKTCDCKPFIPGRPGGRPGSK